MTRSRCGHCEEDPTEHECDHYTEPYDRLEEMRDD